MAAAGVSAHAEKRVALVIGNSGYQHVARLANPAWPTDRASATRRAREPTVLQSVDGGCRQSGSIPAEQRRQRLGEVAGRYPLQIQVGSSVSIDFDRRM